MNTPSIDAIELAVFQSAVHSIAEEMGAALRRTAISPNIKERRDYSCAVFANLPQNLVILSEAKDLHFAPAHTSATIPQVIAMGDHMPVHLGSMPASVGAALQQLPLAPGDIAILNDPYAGGTHLPDITMVMPVFVGDSAAPDFYVAARAHHADVGGMFPGSMGPCREIFQEGLRIPPTRIVKSGETQHEVLNLILLNVRTPQEREGDLAAQIGACRVGEQRLLDLAGRWPREHLAALSSELLHYSERLVRAELRKLPAGTFIAEDFLDDDGTGAGPLRIAVSLCIDPVAATLTADFSGTCQQVRGSVNAVRAITLSACFYVLRCLLGDDAPSTAGILRPLTLIAPEGTLVNAQSPAPVAGANVETSQRIVDVLLRALAAAAADRIPAASAGTMSNLSIGGFDFRTQSPFTYYETCAGGMGARPSADGVSGVQTHMTNSLNTPVEALEFAYPFRVHRYSYRANSGGAGLQRGGDGLIRELELLADADLTLLADRRAHSPYGLDGGNPGSPGRATLIDPTAQAETTLPGKCSRHVPRGTRIRLETPGGGGWGKCPEQSS